MQHNEKIQSQIINIGHNCCLVHCYLYCIGIEPSTIEYFKITYDAIRAGVEKSGVESDCTVSNPERFLKWLTGKDFTVNKKVVVSIKDIKEPTPVRFVAPGYTPHFVVVENGEIVYDGYADSQSVAKGKAADARIIKLK